MSGSHLSDVVLEYKIRNFLGDSFRKRSRIHRIWFDSGTCPRQLTKFFLLGQGCLHAHCYARQFGPDSTDTCGGSTGPVLGQVVVDVFVVVQRQVSTLTVETPQLHFIAGVNGHLLRNRDRYAHVQFLAVSRRDEETPVEIPQVVTAM